MKRKLFIGSSREGLVFATEVKRQIDLVCGEWIKTDLWNGGEVFSVNKSTLECLSNASRKYDYGILVASADDLRLSRDNIDIIPRDNVIFEMGMFLGSQGLTRAFMLVEENNTLPSDYNGITIPIFQRENPQSLISAIEQIVSAIQRTKNSSNIKPIPSTALALGYFENYVQKVANLKLESGEDFTLNIIIPTNLSNIYTSRKVYQSKNPSKEISVSKEYKRPTYFKYNDIENSYWDMPTTLSTLDKLIEMVLRSSEVGNNPEKDAWIEHELMNFKSTLEVLASRCDACKGHVLFEFLN